MSPLVGVEGAVGWLESRADTRWMTHNRFNSSRGAGIYQSAANQTASEQMLFNELKFAAAKSIRTSTIILAVFNVIAAFATALAILCDAYFRERRNNRQFGFRRNGFTFVPDGEVFPLVLSVGIIIQSSVFAGAQSTGLDSLFGAGCTRLAQLMMPAVFIVPYTQLVFAVEIAIRALRKQPFAPRARYNVSTCLSIIGMLILANFLVAVFDRSPNFCLTSLFWFVAHYSVLCFALFVAITAIVFICTVVIFVRLLRSTKVEVTARVSASRMVYYLALAVISNAFVLPFFFVQAVMQARDPDPNPNALTLSMIASVVSNVSGLMTGGLYLFLKSSTLSTIGPRDKAGEYENRRAKYKIRRYEPGDADDDGDGIDSHMMNPVTGPRSLRRANNEASPRRTEKEEEALDGKSVRSASKASGRRSPDSLRSNKFVSAAMSAIMPKPPEPARATPAPVTVGHIRKRSYSLFPRSTLASKSSLALLPATTYSPSDALKPPPSMANLAKMRHRRDSSMVSSATVQIGLRLSSVDDLPQLVQNNVVANDNEVHSIYYPSIVKDSHSAAKVIETQAQKRPEVSVPEVEDGRPTRDPVKDAKMKTLPPVPPINSQPVVEVPQDEITLSPSVYSPTSPTKARLPSPRGVGFSMPVSKPANGAGVRNAPVPPPYRRGTAESVTAAPPTDTKSAWI